MFYPSMTFGKPIIEGMISVPVVGTNIPPIKELALQNAYLILMTIKDLGKNFYH